MFCSDNDRKDNTTNTRNDGPYKPYFDTRADGGKFAGIPVPWSRHLYFDDNWLARHSWVARVAISAYVLVRSPVVSVPDPTERLIGMVRERVVAAPDSWWVCNSTSRSLRPICASAAFPTRRSTVPITMAVTVTTGHPKATNLLPIAS